MVEWTTGALEELEGQSWGEADANATSLVRECHRLRKVPVRKLSNDELRLLLGQQIGAEWLVSIALDRLREEPLAGDSYPGDLLNAALRADSKHWEIHSDDLAALWAVRTALERIGSQARQLLDRNDWPSFG